MQVGRIIKTGLAAGIVANAWDFAINTFLMPMLQRAPESVYLPEELMIERLVITDFVAAFVFVWFYDRVHSLFGSGAKGGATYGLYAGILINFPMWLMIANLFRGYPYVDAAIWTANGLLWGVVVGAVTGLVWEKTAPAAA
jgi:hypothetical protein